MTPDTALAILNPVGTVHPGEPFFLFGAGARRKLLYTRGVLADALTAEVVARWDAENVHYDPASCALELTAAGTRVRLYEDEAGVWLEQGGRKDRLSGGHVALPDFGTHPHAALLRVLHHEILVNLVAGGPLPNLFVYQKPWYRDAAMVAMVLAHTGNVHLIAPWVEGLLEPFDRNNAGHREPDNLGQALYLVSLVGDRRHPLVESVLEAIPEFLDGDHLVGPSDFAEHPVYQTKWLKFGLRALGLPDPYRIPAVFDSYSALFWMAYRDEHVPGPGFSPELTRPYPYLGWAEAHFWGHEPPLELAGRSYPLTWEGDASQADYAGMSPVDAVYAAARTCLPHTWHAAEMFLYLLEKDRGSTAGPRR